MISGNETNRADIKCFLGSYGPQQYERDLSMLCKWYKEEEYPLADMITDEVKLGDLESGIKAYRAWKTMKVAVLP
jgi:Zn-dependent alcohol dehydrogenase